MKALCYHTLIELHGCPPDRLKRAASARKILTQAVQLGEGTIVRSVFHTFSPWGVSGVIVIQESHVSIHTWPEHGYAALDIFSCSPALKRKLMAQHLAREFGAQRVSIQHLRRGFVSKKSPPKSQPRPSRPG